MSDSIIIIYTNESSYEVRFLWLRKRPSRFNEFMPTITQIQPNQEMVVNRDHYYYYYFEF